MQVFAFGGRPVTGYHLCMFALQFLAFHLGYALGFPVTWQNECLILAAFFLVCPTWDFLWFIFNPAYGLKKFSKEHVEWHAHRWWVFGKFPVDYLAAALLSCFFAAWWAWPFDDLNRLFGIIGAYWIWFVLLFVVVDLIGPWYRRLHVGLLAGNAPPIFETNVDDEDAEAEILEEELEFEALEDAEEDVLPPSPDSPGNG